MYLVIRSREVPWRLRRRWESIFCSVRTFLRGGVPGGVELDEDVGELGDDAREILVGEHEDVVFFGVGLG